MQEKRITQEQITALEQEIQISQKVQGEGSYEQEKINLSEIEQKFLTQAQELAEWNAVQQEHAQIKEKIGALEFCPLCQQTVSHEHKMSIMSQKQAVLSELTKKINQESFQHTNSISRSFLPNKC